MTGQEINTYWDGIKEKTVQELADAIYLNNEGAADGMVATFNEARFGPDVRADITKLSMLLRALGSGIDEQYNAVVAAAGEIANAKFETRLLTQDSNISDFADTDDDINKTIIWRRRLGESDELPAGLPGEISSTNQFIILHIFTENAGRKSALQILTTTKNTTDTDDNLMFIRRYNGSAWENGGWHNVTLMAQSVYDPQGKKTDVYAYANAAAVEPLTNTNLLSVYGHHDNVQSSYGVSFTWDGDTCIIDGTMISDSAFDAEAVMWNHADGKPAWLQKGMRYRGDLNLIAAADNANTDKVSLKFTFRATGKADRIIRLTDGQYLTVPDYKTVSIALSVDKSLSAAESRHVYGRFTVGLGATPDFFDATIGGEKIATEIGTMLRRERPSRDLDDYLTTGFYVLEFGNTTDKKYFHLPIENDTGRRVVFVMEGTPGGVNSPRLMIYYNMTYKRMFMRYGEHKQDQPSGVITWDDNWSEMCNIIDNTLKKPGIAADAAAVGAAIASALVRRENPEVLDYDNMTDVGYHTFGYGANIAHDVSGTGKDGGQRVLIVAQGPSQYTGYVLYQILINKSYHEAHMRVRTLGSWNQWEPLFSEKETTAKLLQKTLGIEYSTVALASTMALTERGINLTTGVIADYSYNPKFDKCTVLAGPGAASDETKADARDESGMPYAEFGVDISGTKKIYIEQRAYQIYVVLYDESGNVVAKKGWYIYSKDNPVTIINAAGCKYLRLIVSYAPGKMPNPFVNISGEDIAANIKILNVTNDGDTSSQSAWMLTRSAFLPADSARLIYKGGKSWKYHWNSVEAFEAAGKDPRCWGMIGDIRCYDDGNGNHSFFCFHDAKLDNQTTGEGSPYTIADPDEYSKASVEDFRNALSEVKYNKGVWSIVDNSFTNIPDLDTIPVGAGNPTKNGSAAISNGTIAYLEDFLRICRKYGKIAILEPKGDVKSEATRFWGDETIIDEIMRVVDGYGMRNSVMWIMSGNNNPNRKADTYLADNYPGVYRVWRRYDHISDYKQTTYDAYVTTHTDPALVYFLPLEDRINNEAEFDDFVKKIHKNGQLVITHISRRNSTLTQTCTNGYVIDCMLDGFLIYRDLILQ